jgi:hypothetical protein
MRNYAMPSKTQLMRAWKLKKAGFTDKRIAEVLHVSIHWFALRKTCFLEYFEKRLQLEASIREGDFENRARSTPILFSDARQRLIEAVSYGLDIGQALKLIGISSNTYWHLCQKDPSLQEAMETARANLDIDVVKSLFRRAKGLQVENASKTVFKDGRGNIIQQTESSQTRTLPPSVAAAEFWLTNRQAWYKTSQKPSVNLDTDKTEFDIVRNLYEDKDKEETEAQENNAE